MHGGIGARKLKCWWRDEAVERFGVGRFADGGFWLTQREPLNVRIHAAATAQ